MVDESGIISDALKRIPIFENSKRLIHPGARYELPKQDETKHDPFTCREQDLDDQRPLSAQLHGTSPLLARELQYRMQKQEPLASVMHEIRESHTLYLHSSGEKTLFHCIPLMHLGSEPTTFPLMEGMDVLFYEKEERVRIKQQSGDIARVIRRELNKDRNKLPKLLQALDEAMDCERYREYGDLLFAYGSQLQKQPTITLPSFEREEEVTIPIDMRFDLRHNANRYYQKYHKQRRAQSILKEQIALCEEQIRYFEQLEAQLEIASVPDAVSYTHLVVDLTAHLVDDLFDASRLDASVLDQILQRQTGDLATDRIKTGNRDRFRRIVDDQIHAGRLFDRFDVSSFATDDASLHLFAWQRDH